MKRTPAQNTAVIGVGSNIDPDIHIPKARDTVAKAHCLIAESRFTQTEPVGYTDQPLFTNGAWLVRTGMQENELVQWLHALEDRLGRVRTESKNSPRTIDLDLIVWNNRIRDPHVYSRDFLKRAVIEVLPELTEQVGVIR